MKRLLWKEFLEKQPDTSRKTEEFARLKPNKMNFDQHQIPIDLILQPLS